MITRKKDTRFNKFAKKFLIVVSALFVVGFVWLTSYESDLNIKRQSVEKEIAVIESDIDGLNLKKQELESFARVSSIATKNGYTYQQTTTAAVVGVQRD